MLWFLMSRENWMADLKNYSEPHDTNLLINTREIFLRSNSSQEEPSINHIVSEKFLINLRILEEINSAPIIVHQQTIGGDWFAGMAIYDAIRMSPCKFVFVCHGICASMGSIIAQAVVGNGTRVSMPNCDWLIHEGSCSFTGTYRQVFSLYEFEKKALEKSYKILSDAAYETLGKSKSKSQVKSFIKKQLASKEDWWLSSEDACSHGFADGIMGSKGFESLKKIYKNVS